MKQFSPYGLPVILIAFIFLGLLYDLSVPFFEKPDELKHFAVIQYIQSHQRLPVVRAGVYKPWDQEGTQPPLYHLLVAALVSWLDLSDFEEPARNPHYVDERSFVWRERGNNNLYLHPPGETWSTAPVLLAARLARWLSLLAGLGTISLTYLLARIIFETDSSPLPSCPPAPLLPLLAAALVAFIPQFLHVSSAITNDSLSATLAAAALVLLALVIKNGSSTHYAVYLGLVLGLAAITKLSLLYLVPLTGLVLLLDLRRHRAPGRLLGYGAIIGSLMLLLAGWWYARNWHLYGDFTALNAHLLYRGGPLDPRPTLAQIWQTELIGLELSFWAAFGAGQILLEPWLYTGLGWIKYLVLVGLGIGVWRWVSRFTSLALRVHVSRHLPCGFTFHASRFTLHVSHFTLLALWTVIIFIALLRWMQITPASWGRLLYPTLPALAILAVWGLAQFGLNDQRPMTNDEGQKTNQSPRTTHHAPRSTLFALRSSLPLLPSLLAILLFLLSLISPFRYIQYAYAKTPLMTEAEVPGKGVVQLDFVYDDVLRLIGYKVEKPAVEPGEWLPVTLYWQAVRPMDRNYSAFVHLLDHHGQAIGQANTYPDGGNWPTSMLEPGGVLKDTYYVYVPAGVAGPVLTRLAMGIFEFEDPARAAKPAVNASGERVEPIVAGVPLLPHQWPELKPGRSLVVNFGGQIKLVGYDWSPEQKIMPGAVLPLTLYWETLAPPGQHLNLFIHLVDPATESQVAGFDGPPDYPTGYWQPGNTIIDARRLALPADLPPGDYELRIGWYNLDDLARLPLVEGHGSGDALSLLTISVE